MEEIYYNKETNLLDLIEECVSFEFYDRRVPGEPINVQVMCGHEALAKIYNDITESYINRLAETHNHFFKTDAKLQNITTTIINLPFGGALHLEHNPYFDNNENSPISSEGFPHTSYTAIIFVGDEPKFKFVNYVTQKD